MGSGTSKSTIPTPATPDVCTAKVLVEGKEITGEWHVLSIAVMRELNRIPSAVIHLKDGDAAKSTFEISNKEDLVPGKEIEIQLGYHAKEDSVFKGIIVRHSIKIRRNSSHLILECRDKAVKMTSGLKSFYYLDQKDGAILEDIIGRNGLTKDVEATTPDLKEVVQYESSDWDFMLCRAEANGLVVMVEDGKVIVAKPDHTKEPVLTVEYGSTIIELDAEIDARLQSPGIKASSWDASGQELIETDAKEPSGKTNGNIPGKKLSEVIGGDPHAVRHGGKLSKPELQAWADGRLLKERLAKVRGRAQFQGFAGILPGQVIEVLGIGERFEGKALASGVRHQMTGGNWITDVQFGLSPELFSETYNLRPLPAAGLLPSVSGLQIGIVNKIDGDPDGEDRIQVKLPLINIKEEGIWARISTLDAGKERGTFFRPEVDDEVIVGFLNDDPRHPVVLGMCHSSAKPAPETATAENDLKGYVSREKMKMTFDDGKKIIAFETPGGNKLTISDEDKGIVLEDQNGNKITMNADGIMIESAKDLIFKAKKDIKMEGANVEIKAKSAFKAEGTSSAEVSGASTTLKGSAKTVVQGGIVQIN